MHPGCIRRASCQRITAPLLNSPLLRFSPGIILIKSPCGRGATRRRSPAMTDSVKYVSGTPKPGKSELFDSRV